MSGVEELAKIRHGGTTCVQLSPESVEDAQSLKPSGTLNLGEKELELLIDATKTEQTEGALNFSLCGVGLNTVHWTDSSASWARLVQLDLSNNRLGESLEGWKIGGPGCFLRSLSLQQNNLQALGGFAQMNYLLELDISSNSFQSSGIDIVAKVAPRLRVFIAHHCELDSSALPVLGEMPNLEEVDVSFNRLADSPSLKNAFDRIRRGLQRVAIHGNPLSTIEIDALEQWLRTNCPKLKSLEGRHVQAVFHHHASPSEMQSRSINDGAILQDSSSCSCLEGNPCAVPYNCLNWKDRFEVAKSHRAELHYQLHA